MINLLKKPVTVEEIHAEFDSAEENILKKCDILLAELEIPTETQVERKADMLFNLGFVNSETVKQTEIIKNNKKSIELKIAITSREANSIRELKLKYPREKFITEEELERICDKYNLIHAPVANYIKDVPEKNVLEISNRKKLEKIDSFEEHLILSGFNDLGLVLIDKLGKKNNPIFNLNEIIELNKCWNINNTGSYAIKDINNASDNWFSIGGRYYLQKFGIQSNDYPTFESSTVIKKDGLFIAAPESHFDLKCLSKKSKFGFFEVKVTEVKDPVVFEYCKNNIVRIITKWGTDDDKSYLDSVLLNEKLN